MKMMSEFVCSVAVCLAACALSGVAPVVAQAYQTQPASAYELRPSPLEAFAARSTAIVVWSKAIGQLESRDAHATITALIIEDKASESVMRGVRIDLAHTFLPHACDWKYVAWRIMCQRANAAIYIEEKRLEEVRNGIERGAAELRPSEFISQYRGQDASDWGATGLIVCGYQFPDRRPKELAELFTRGVAELRTASR